MKFKAILFDLDGTILNTDEMIVKVFEELYRVYRNGVMTPKEQIYYFSGPPLLDTVKKEFPNQDPNFMISEFEELSPLYYDKYVSLYPGSFEVLDALKKMHIKLGVVTNKLRGTAVKSLKQFGLYNFFDVIVALDDVNYPKPNEEGVLKAMSLLRISDPNDVLYVGDNAIDYLTSLNAGVKSALVVWGPRILDNKLNPDIKVKTFKELLDYAKES